MQRKKANSEVEAKVLIESRRRCAFCFGLHGDLAEKKGQIAHVDHDCSKSEIDDLAWLCLEHHDAYDSKSSQSKGLTPAELRIYRDDLYKVLKTDGALWAGSKSKKTRAKVSNKPPKTRESIPFEIYERRNQVYQAAKEIIAHAISSGSMDFEHAFKFAQASESALFLFDDDIDAYLREIYQRAIRLRAVNRHLEYVPIGEGRNALANEDSALLLWFTDAYEVLRQKMKSYLRFN